MAAASPREAPAAEAEVLLRALDQGVGGPIRRARISVFYYFGLLLAGVAMLMLPLAYLGLIAAIAWGLYLHIMGEAVSLSDPAAFRSSLFFYVVPIIAGIPLIIFLIKPILAPRARRFRTRALKPQDQPLLFDYIRKVCKLMGALEPDRIEVSCDTGIQIEPGSLLAAMIGRDLTLRIGLPLVYELDLRQFTGCLAHEFSHGGRGFGMRLWAVIQRIDGFFHRLVCERDDWDEALKNSLEHPNILVRWVVSATIKLIAISRWALWVFMKAGDLVSSFLSRQMKYDADRKAAGVVGANGVTGGLFTAELLGIAWRKSMDDVDQAREERRVADDLPALVHDNFSQIGDGMREHVRESLMARRTGPLSMLPPAWDRIRRLEKQNEKGIFFDERPATLLFRDFGALCHDVSMDFYAAAIGPALMQTAVVPTAELIGRRDSVSGNFDALKQYSLGYYLFTRLIGPDPEAIAAAADPRSVAGDMQRARGYLEAAAGLIRPALKLYVKGCQQTLQGFAIDQQIQAGIHSRSASEEMARELIQSGDAMKMEAEVQIAPFEDALMRRMTAALRLLESPQLNGLIEDGHQLARQAAQIAMAIEGMHNCADLVDDLIRSHQGLRALVTNVKGREQDDLLTARIRFMRGEVYRSIDALFMRLKSTPYPFEHPNGRVSISHVAIDIPPAREDLVAIYEKGQSTLEALDRLYSKSLGALARMALDVENALGLPPINAAPGR